MIGLEAHEFDTNGFCTVIQELTFSIGKRKSCNVSKHRIKLWDNNTS